MLHANTALRGLLRPPGAPRPGTALSALFRWESRADLAECLAGRCDSAETTLLLAGATPVRLSLISLPGGRRAVLLHPPPPPPDVASEAERLRSLGRLAGGVAHDVNNFLAIILGAVEAARIAAPAAAAELEPAQEAAERGAALVRRLLAFARRQVLAPRVVPVDESVRGTANLLRNLLGQGVTVVLDLDAAGRRVRVDPVQFDQVLLNLAANARDAMGGRGNLTISTALKVALREEPGFPDPLPPGRWTVLSVTDTGPGIPPDVLPRIVEPFFTTKGLAGGTGLGLATVHGIVRQSGGALQVDPSGHPGARFRIHLPRHDGDEGLPEIASEAVRSAPVRPPPPAGSDGLRILLVEDEPALRRLSHAALRRAGHEVTDAEDAEAALDLLRDGLRPAVLVSDVALPGMDGLALARAAREQHPALPVILVSGYAEPALGTDLAAEGMAFLAKPFRPVELIALVSGVATRV